ncbi:MAG: trimeric intracellular cation channel family protein [Myxococcota bacterium]
MNHIEIVLTVFMIIGVIASASAGALRAIESKMDITGAIFLAFVAANAGGTFRDLVLGTQVFWMKYHYYLWISFSVGILMYVLSQIWRAPTAHRYFLKTLIFADAMGLAAFSIAGVEKAQGLGEGPAISILMGVVTAVGGGIVADVISNRSPMVFFSELYIVISFFGAILYLILSDLLGHPVAAGIALVLIVLCRMIAVKLKLGVR